MKRLPQHQARIQNAQARANKFCRSVNIDVWWQEFCAIDDGHYVYSTPWSFAQAKGANDEQKRWVYWMVGPKPQPPHYLSEEAKKQWKSPVPWLGDWQQQRAAVLWPNAPQRIQALERLLKERTDAIEVAKSVAHIPFSWLKKFEVLAQQLDDYFVGNVFDPNLPLAAVEQRAKVYLPLAKQLHELSDKALMRYLECNGFRPADIHALLLAGKVQTEQAQPCDNGSASSGVIDGELTTIEQLTKAGHQLATKTDDPNAPVITSMTLALAEFMVRKSLAFKRPPPDEDAMRQIQQMEAEGKLRKGLDSGDKDKSQ